MSLRDDKAEIAGLGCAGILVLGHLAFWGAVVWVAYHFISKYW